MMKLIRILLISSILCCSLILVESARKQLNVISVVKTKPVSPEKHIQWTQKNERKNNTQMSPHIYNGERAVTGDYPHTVHIGGNFKNDTWTCTGFLISSTCILTAAHCCNNNKITTYTIKAGFVDLDASENSCRQIRVTKTSIIHPNYNNATLVNDICMLKVSPPFNTSTACVKTACVAIEFSRPTSYNRYVGSTQTAVGFGITGDNTDDNFLWYADDLTIENNSECNDYYNMYIPSTQLCVTGLPPDMQSICSGDSGGPLGHNNGDKHCIIGVTSYGSNSCENGAPTGFTFLPPYFNDFIKKYCGSLNCTCT